MERYNEYKDSGVQWLGEIPSHWGLRRTKYVWKETDSRSEFGSEQLLSVSQYDGVREAQSDSRSESLKGYKIVKQDELVINIMLAWLGGLGVSKHEGIVSPAYCVYKLQDAQNPRFLHYLYRTPMYLAEFARHSTGIVPSRWRMYTDDFGEVLTLLPPIEEQDAMVAYLDTATAKIDEAIAQQQKMIGLLNERKQIIINNAVTKGLNPDAPMKDSGVDWIGEIPEHWEVMKTSHIFHHIGSGTTPKSGREDYYSEDGIPFLQTGDLNDGFINETSKHITEKALRDTNLKLYPKGSLVVAMYGATIGKLGILNIDTTVNQACCVLPTSDRVGNKFAMHVLSTAKADLLLKSRGGGQPNISQDTIRNEKIVVPTLAEQNEIVQYIEHSCTPIDGAISNATNQISLLQERKQIIINDVVTGKVKVS